MTIPQLTLTLDNLSVPITGRFVTIGTAPHKLAARFYSKEMQPGVYVCAVWVANALAGQECIDWTYLSIAGPMGTSIDTYPRKGMILGAGLLKIGDGTTQCFPTRRGFVIRFVVNGPRRLLDEVPAIPDPVVNFGPLSQKQPKVNRGAHEPLAQADLLSFRSALSMGGSWAPHFPGLDTECGLMNPPIGFWHVLGPYSPGNPGGDNPGGSDIRFQPGYDQTPAGALLERQRMDQVIERSLHAWDDHGNYLTVEGFGDPGPQYSGSRTPGTSDGELPGYQFPGVGPSACAYRAQLEAVGAYGAAHLERAINPATVAWEYTKDPVAADFLVDLAEEMRLQFSNHGPVQTGPGWQPRNLKNYLALANLNPGHGGDCGRYRGIPAWCVAMAQKVRPKDAYFQWLDMWCEWVDLVQQPNGLWQWSVGDAQFHNQDGVAAAQMFETLYVAFAREAAGRAIGEPQPGAPALRAYDALFVNRKLPKQAYTYNPGSFGPPHFIRVGDSTTGTPDLVCYQGWAAPGETPIGDPTNVEHGISRAWHISGGNAKYQRALEEYGVPGTMAQKLASFDASLDKNWTAGAMSAIQAAQAEQAP